jgi:large subunit ribosomal protein L19
MIMEKRIGERSMNMIDKITEEQLNLNIPEFRVGDTIKVDVKITEGKTKRIQAFEGIVTARKGSKLSETFTVRKKSANIGVDRTFAVHSPLIAQITVIKKGKVRRVKLNFLKKLKGQPRISERN